MALCFGHLIEGYGFSERDEFVGIFLSESLDRMDQNYCGAAKEYLQACIRHIALLKRENSQNGFC